MGQVYRTLRGALACDMRFAAAESAVFGQIEASVASFPADGVLTAKRVLNELTMPAADAFRADAVRFRQLVAADAAQARTAALFAQGLQTRGPLELDLGDRIAALS